MSEQQTVTVNILDKDYQIACPPEERDALHFAAKELDARMRGIRSSGNVIGLERIAIMTALNLCYELQKANKTTSPGNDEDLQRMLKKLDEALQ